MPNSMPNIINKTLVLSDTEYSQALASFASKFMIQCRGLSDIKISFTGTESGTKYITIPAGSSFSENGVFSGILTIYMQSSSAGAVVEILEWR